MPKDNINVYELIDGIFYTNRERYTSHDSFSMLCRLLQSKDSFEHLGDGRMQDTGFYYSEN